MQFVVIATIIEPVWTSNLNNEDRLLFIPSSPQQHYVNFLRMSMVGSCEPGLVSVETGSQ